MRKLTDLHGIGSVLAEKLETAGIPTPHALREMGGKAAFEAIYRNDPTACLNMLYALEAGARGIPKKELPEGTKLDLKAFHHALKNTVS